MARNCKTKICGVCGNEFIPTYGNRKYCSNECAERKNRERYQPRRQLRACPVCGKEFIPLNGNRKYCSNECCEKGAKERQRRYRAMNREKYREYNRNWKKTNAEKVAEYNRRYRSGKKSNAPREKTGDKWIKDWRETSQLADEKPEACKFDGPCIECPYPDCVES